ncbi:MAG: hypothetical protein IKV94_01810 [Clostridia bacterium]|nr:hypothetical protein [Clostridia bacterium]
MKKSTSIKNRLESVKSDIRAGLTWDEIEVKYGVTKAYLQICLKASYSNMVAYNTLLAKARENQAARENNTVVVTETGALLNFYDEVIEPRKQSAVCAPAFCKKEISKITNAPEDSKKKILSSKKITWVERAEREQLAVKPNTAEPVKPRAFGVVALCCSLSKEGKNVVLKTNSRQIAALAEAQGLGIKVVKF